MKNPKLLINQKEFKSNSERSYSAIEYLRTSFGILFKLPYIYIYSKKDKAKTLLCKTSKKMTLK